MKVETGEKAQALQSQRAKGIPPEVIEAHIRNARKLRAEALRDMAGAVWRGLTARDEKPAVKGHGVAKAV